MRNLKEQTNANKKARSYTGFFVVLKIS